MSDHLPPDALLIDNETGEAPVLLHDGDRLIMMGEPKEQRTGPPRQLCEVRRAMPAEEAEVASYDAIEVLRGRIEVATLAERSIGTPRLRAQRLRQAARLVQIAVNDLAHAIERSPNRQEP